MPDPVVVLIEDEPQIRRFLRATLTGQGRAVLKRAEAVVREADARILARLTGPQQREFKRMLHRLGSD